MNKLTFSLFLVGVIFLAGCGGGGGGTTGGLIVPTPPQNDNLQTNGVTNTPINIAGIEPYLAPEHIKVNVGIVDSGVRTNHFRISPSLIETHISSDSTTIDDVEEIHGTYVAQIIANGTRNENLFISKATAANRTLTTDNIYESTQWLQTKNVRVINYSIAPFYFTTDFFTNQVFNTNRANNIVSVVSAGNKTSIFAINGNLSSEISTSPSVFDSAYQSGAVLFVGALDQNNNLASYSYIPGERSDIQSRFLVANAPVILDAKSSNGTNQGTIDFSGTSATAPIVTAAVVNLLARWPSLTSQQVTDLILNNTDRTFTNLYSQNNCGTGGTTNCGLYYFGQGKLDMLAALQPLGTVSVAMASNVGGESVALSSSNITLPAAFGDAANSINVKSAAFDSIGRDYQFNVGSFIGTQKNGTVMRSFENRMKQQDFEFADSNMNMKFGFNDGSVTYSKFGLSGDVFSFNFAQNNNMRNVVDTKFGDYLSFNSKGVLAGYNEMNQFGFGFNISPSVNMYSKITRASMEVNGQEAPNVATQQEVGFNFNVAKNSKITIGYEVTTEDKSMFGLSGNGAFELNNNFNQATKIQLTNDHKNGWTSFGMVKLGSMTTDGKGLLSSITDAKTSEFAGGFSWKGDDKRISFLVSQPIRVDSARASFNVATGRTLSGEVIRDTLVANLKPSGRQINMEVSYEQKLDENQRFNIYTIYMKDVGHVRNNNDFFIGGVYKILW